VPFSEVTAQTTSFNELVKPPKENEGQSYTFLDEDFKTCYKFADWLKRTFHDNWETIKNEGFGQSKVPTSVQLSQKLVSLLNYNMHFRNSDNSIYLKEQHLYKLYEAFIRGRFKERGRDLLHICFVEYLVKEGVPMDEKRQIELTARRCNRLLGDLTLIRGILYSIARVALWSLLSQVYRKLQKRFT